MFRESNKIFSFPTLRLSRQVAQKICKTFWLESGLSLNQLWKVWRTSENVRYSTRCLPREPICLKIVNLTQ